MPSKMKAGVATSIPAALLLASQPSLHYLCHGFQVAPDRPCPKGSFFGRVLADAPWRQRITHRRRRRRPNHPTTTTTTTSMKIRVGIVGLPNVGKSTLFNSLAGRSIARAENFPFCTVEPNVAPIAVPDDDGDGHDVLERLGTFAKSRRTVPATMDWIDVAGLAKGASRGEGLGNRFLATVRECDAICHVVRALDDPDVVHVDGRVDPTEDASVVNLELLLADLAHVERRIEKTTCGGSEREALEKVAEGLERGVPARSIGLSDAEAFAIKSMGLLTLKPVLYAFNVDEIDFALGREDALTNVASILRSAPHSDPERDAHVVVSAKVEAAASDLDSDEERREYLSSALGIETGSKDFSDPDDFLSYRVLPSAMRRLLRLCLAYTGPGVPPERSRTTRAHLFRRGSLTAGGLAGRLHGDIQKGFIRAEVTRAEELLGCDSYAAAKEEGLVQTEGKDYVLESGDVVLVKWK